MKLAELEGKFFFVVVYVMEAPELMTRLFNSFCLVKTVVVETTQTLVVACDIGPLVALLSCKFDLSSKSSSELLSNDVVNELET